MKCSICKTDNYLRVCECGVCICDMCYTSGYHKCSPVYVFNNGFSNISLDDLKEFSNYLDIKNKYFLALLNNRKDT